MTHTYTSTYAILEVSKSTMDDILKRLQKVNMGEEYYDKEKKLIVFGTVGLREETKKARKYRCLRCKSDVINGRCKCTTSPSPWEPIE